MSVACQTAQDLGQLNRRMLSLRAQIAQMETKNGNVNTRLQELKKALSKLEADYALCVSAPVRTMTPAASPA